MSVDWGMDKEDTVHTYNSILPHLQQHGQTKTVSYWVEVSQRRRSIVWDPLYVESKKKWYKWTYLQSRKRLVDLGNEFIVTPGKGREKG